MRSETCRKHNRQRANLNAARWLCELEPVPLDGQIGLGAQEFIAAFVACVSQKMMDGLPFGAGKLAGPGDECIDFGIGVDELVLENFVQIHIGQVACGLEPLCLLSYYRVVNLRGQFQQRQHHANALVYDAAVLSSEYINAGK